MRQYIGARYVTKVYTNSQDPSSAEWEAGVVYEPLTLVTYQNSSYLSRTEVPSSAGDPTVATQYWAQTGYYNGQIASILDRVADLESEYASLNGDFTALSNRYTNIWHNKKVVVYGDSLSVTTHNYWQYMVEKDPTIQLTNRAAGGTRIQDGYTLIQAATDLDQFDIIVLAYGTNSWAGTGLLEMGEKYIDTFEEIMSKNDEAQIVCIAPYYAYHPDYGVSGINDLGYSMYDYASTITYICNMYGGIAFNLYDLAGVNQWNYTTLLEPSTGGKYLHENEILGRRIADILLAAPPSQSLSQAYHYISLGTNTGLIIIKMQQFFMIYLRGTCLATDLEAVDLNHIAPAWSTPGWLRDRDNKDQIALVSLSSSGTFTISWPGTAGINVQGLSMFGVSRQFQPH